MAANRPVVYLAGAENYDSIHHVFTVDGYRGSDSRFHMNYGGDGNGNNWAKMNSFTYAGYTFNKNQKAIIGIQPPPSLNVSSTSLSFTGFTGQTYTKSFTVTGKYLTGNLTISKSGSAVYSVSPTSLTPAQAAAGATVKVTYKPTAAGTQTGKITISGGGASTKTVTLTGTATKPTVTVSPTSLTFSDITVGKSASKQFSVNGNLTGSITLKVNGTGFTINKTTITPTEAKEGAIITVTYKPTAAGTHTGSITLNGGGVSNKTVTLKGTAVNRTIITSPTSLRIISAKPFSASKTFTVKGTNLNSSVLLRVSNWVFKLDKTTLTAAQANAGATVKVTFTPTSLGTFTGKVTISGGNAASTATVTLTGVCNAEAAIMSPTITPSMLIDGLLNNDAEVLKNPDADVNGDGKVDINDVKALINLQLVEIVEAE